MKSERGVAAVTAVLIVAVAASAAAFMLAQQSALLNQATLVASRAQADLYAQAGLDWARGVVAQDARSSGSVDSLDEPWAQPIGALPVERALVSGQLVDEQGKFNLNNLVRDSSGGVASPEDVEILKRLLENLGYSPDLAWAVLDWIDFDGDLSDPSGAENAYYLGLPRPYRAANRLMVQVEELYRVRGFTPELVAKLKPHVTALPKRTSVNINTTTEEVLWAILPELAHDEVRSHIAARRSKPFRSRKDIADRIGSKAVPGVITRDLDVKTDFFTAQVRVAQDDIQLATEALIQRGRNAATAIVWRRPLY